jgi:integrase/recombinase XerD
MHLAEAVSTFLRHCRLERGLCKLTLTAYQLDLGQFRQQQRNDPAVADICKYIVREYLGWLDERFQPRSIKRKLATLKSFFTFLEQEEIIKASPFRKPRLRLERAKSLPRILSVSFVARLLQGVYARRGEAPTAFRTYQRGRG